MKVAIIDDSLFMRRLIRSALASLQPDAQITEYPDAVKALEDLESFSPDVITLDMLMPNMSGLDFLEQLKGKSVKAQVIVMTADIQKSVRLKCAEYGVSDFIDKPITLEKLQPALAKLVLA